jgi:SAM-dependent methyltransferase
MSPTFCGYARQDKVWIKDPDGNFWEVYIVEEDVDPSVVRRSLEGPTAQQSTPTAPVVWEHFVTQNLYGPVAHDDDSVDEVRLVGSFIALLDETARMFVVREAFRVLKPGGKVMTHGLMGDSPLPGPQPKLPGLAAMVERVPVRDEAISFLRLAGFLNVQAVKLTEKPWFVHDGVGLREVKFVAWKPQDCADGETRQVLYRGPFAEATADGGWVFARGQRVSVPAAVWHNLRLGPAAEQFLFFEQGVGGSCSGV